MQTFAKLTLILLLLSTRLLGQDSEIDRLMKGELKMTFPSIHFKHKSTDYATMPYSADSCFKFIANHFKGNINDLEIWRDTLETEELTNKRIEILKVGLRKYLKHGKIEIHSMENEQKVSRHTMAMTSDSTKIKYLLTLNSVFDISKTQTQNTTAIKPHKVSHLPCWMNLRLNKAGRKRCKMERSIINKSKVQLKKKRRRLVWTGWKTGFHWSTAG